MTANNERPFTTKKKQKKPNMENFKITGAKKKLHLELRMLGNTGPTYSVTQHTRPKLYFFFGARMALKFFTFVFFVLKGLSLFAVTYEISKEKNSQKLLLLLVTSLEQPLKNCTEIVTPLHIFLNFSLKPELLVSTTYFQKKLMFHRLE